MAKTKAIKGVPGQKVVKIARTNPDDLRPIATNDFLVSHSEKEFFLTFSIMEPPTILDVAELLKLHQIEAVAVAKLVLSPEFAKRILKALEKNIEGFESNDNDKPETSD